MAAPVIISAAVVFVASMVALLVPVYRRRALRVAEIAAWLVPAWLVMGAMVLGAISFALHHADKLTGRAHAPSHYECGEGFADRGRLGDALGGGLGRPR